MASEGTPPPEEVLDEPTREKARKTLRVLYIAMAIGVLTPLLLLLFSTGNWAATLPSD